MRVRFNRYKDGKKKALTMSYDDGNYADIRLIEIFNRYGIKGTFHLNSGLMSPEWTVNPEEIKSLYEGHEVSAHSLTHHFMECIPQEEICYEVLEDRRLLEGMCGYPVCGASYPQGTYNANLVETLRMLGYRYCRTTHATGKLALPDDFLLWHPTCHQKEALDCLTEFLKLEAWRKLSLFMVWGHGFEFDRENSGVSWEMIEEFCTRIADAADVWHATAMEVCRYVNAVRNAEVSCDGKNVYNPSAETLFLEYQEKIRQIAPGETAILP